MNQFKYLELEHLLRKDIQANHFLPSGKLPSVREICQNLGFSKATVLHALHRLEAEGLIFSKPKSGYFVKTETHHDRLPPKRINPPAAPRDVTVPAILRDIMARSAAFDILPTAGTANDASHLITLNRHLSKALRSRPTQKALYYNDSSGDMRLKDAIVNHYRHRGLNQDPAQVCITGGCQHALFISLMATCSPGDTVAVESPAFYGVLQIMEQLKLKIIEVATDPSEGLSIEDLAKKITEWPIKACITSPNYATPTGACMPEKARQELINLAIEKDFCIIEDDIYGDLSFPPFTAEPLKKLDPDGRVILCSSFSKSLSRDLRIGWVFGGKWHDKIAQLKLVTQLSSSESTQQGLATFLEEGHYRRYLAQQVNTLKQQQRELMTLLSNHWHDEIRYTNAQGGISMWVELDETINTQNSYNKVLEQGVIMTPGSLFSASGQYKNFLRLSYIHPLTEKRQAAVKKLFSVLLGH
ncbi:PLP-dependent aminotransferase family protein [Thalassolituus sp. ST750PaO-4]|uniref:aminotransferase-like domain-containing protein n=1 Tax=Thalassolituus sp. ST750PaO-4 TaxID=2742965 RepID=UPI000C60BEB9|nr:PLP-dependent aminotransferase family protein [Thalassolituus sp. ST750PaO-4]MCA6061255.1 PLP-dependent aminotransferase family protein [Thalassolituus sp. ST750PaO-4]PIQ39995.1 MAG: GntR family transcriptional regulator [Thalassolituus sp. CG17_big_fil_post_rev_8_21_14_2_50_53_8]